MHSFPLLGIISKCSPEGIEQAGIFFLAEWKRRRLLDFNPAYFRYARQPLALPAVTQERSQAFANFGAGEGSRIHICPRGGVVRNNSRVRSRTRNTDLLS